MFGNTYTGKKVIITGHTGFKGSWLSTWLISLGADVVGISKDIPTSPSMFNELGIEEKLTHYTADICNLGLIKKIIDKEQPDFLFHLAAQALVSVSYDNPTETILTNVVGTMNVLEGMRNIKKKCQIILITSDKCYDNVEWLWGYRESDNLGGRDIYSGSKGAAELIIKSYISSFFKNKESNSSIGICRAGNVIGGGDWAKDRIVVDCMRSWSKGDSVEVRSPDATRPWQHVLEPLSGYLALGMALSKGNNLHGEAFNFGPRSMKNYKVSELLMDLSKYWEFKNKREVFTVVDRIPFHEAGLLKLNCDKALFHLNWEANLGYEDTIKFTSEWYYKYYRKNVNMYDLTLKQISEYEKTAQERNLAWTA